MAEKASIDRTGDIGSAWVRTGNAHRVSAIGVPALCLRPRRRGNRDCGNDRNAGREEMLTLHRGVSVVEQLGRCALAIVLFNWMSG